MRNEQCHHLGERARFDPKRLAQRYGPPRMSPVRLKIAAWPLRNTRMTSDSLIVA
jgi:hypothetical protein